jgi:hypothetical protein
VALCGSEQWRNKDAWYGARRLRCDGLSPGCKMGEGRWPSDEDGQGKRGQM